MSRSSQLLDLERKMLDAVERAYDQWMESEGPIPLTLVKLMKDTHSAILGRLAKKYGDDRDDPMAALIEIEKERDALRKIIDMQNRGMLQ